MGDATKLRQNVRPHHAGRARAMEGPQHHAATATAPSPLVTLQQSIGNRAVGRLVQAKLKMGRPGDRFEREADRVADLVMRLPAAGVAATAAPPIIGRKGADLEAEERRAAPTEPKSTSDEGLRSVHEVLRSPGEPLDQATRAFMEARFGHDFSGVRVHSGAAAARSAMALSAKAYTVGHDVVFGTGGFAPGTATGQRLIAHELTHVVQQSGGSAPLRHALVHTAHPSSAGPVIQRQPDPKRMPPKKPPDVPPPKQRDPVAELGTIVSGRSALKDLKAWLDLHPADLSVAETFLLKKAETSTTERGGGSGKPSCGSLRARPEVDRTGDPQGPSETEDGRGVGAIRDGGGHHSRSTSGPAIPGSATALLRSSRPRRRRPTRRNSYDTLRSDSAKLLKGLRTQRATLMKDLQRRLSTLPMRTSATFAPTHEQDLVTKLLHQMERGIARAQGIRRQSYEIYTTRTPEGSVAAEISSLNRQRAAAETSLKAAQQELEDAKKLTGANAAAKVAAATTKVKKAEDRTKAAAATRTKASAGAARTMKYQEDPSEKQRVDVEFRACRAPARRLSPGTGGPAVVVHGAGRR